LLLKGHPYTRLGKTGATGLEKTQKVGLIKQSFLQKLGGGYSDFPDGATAEGGIFPPQKFHRELEKNL